MNVGMRPGTRTFLLVTAFGLLAAATAASAADDLAGRWRGELPGPQGEIAQILQFQQDQTGRWTGTTRLSTDPDTIHDLEALTVDGTRVTFQGDLGEGVRGTARYALTLRPVTDQLRGSLILSTPMGERTVDVQFERVADRAETEGISYIPDRPVVGAWSARPDDEDEEREILLDILPEADAYKGTITDTGVGETVAMRDLEVKDGSVVSFNFRFEGAPFMSSFWGRYDEVRDQIRGTMSVGGRSQVLRFERTSQGPDDVADALAGRQEPLPVKHAYSFAVTLRGAYWHPLYVLKENERNLNDITTAEFAFDASARFHIVDYLAIQARYVRGGLGFDTNAENLALFAPVDGPQGTGLSAGPTTDSFLAMDGFEFSVVGYLGQNVLPDSDFNPFLTLTMGRMNWELTESGRGSDPLAIFERPLEGTDWTFGGGVGTEYAVNERFGLEFEWLWAYTTTEDETQWEDITHQWTNQHVYRFSLGGVVWF